ncbi:hypothetical protein [Janthinobacterium sp. HH106]|uniref:hypothetical protein n=1 Tax=Janthinobacterium sp. HH106 TaxID=1537278 RepID=UPI0015867826|nr:hypothetical protein [Janthinobacterium sp. HH106]
MKPDAPVTSIFLDIISINAKKIRLAEFPRFAKPAQGCARNKKARRIAAAGFIFMQMAGVGKPP